MRRNNFFASGRGLRFANRRWWAGFTESVLAASLVLIGVVLLAVFATMAVLYSTPDQLYISTWLFAAQLLVAVALIGVGSYLVVTTLWKVSVSPERRDAIKSQANELEIFNELRQRPVDQPTIPRLPTRPGSVQPFQLIAQPTNLWGLITSGSLAVIFVALVTILALTAVASKSVDWLAAGLLIPASLATAWFLYLFFRQFLKLSGIGVTTLELSSWPLIPGRESRMFLSQPARVRLRLLDVSLVCSEQATFSQGTDIRTESRNVFEQRLLKQRGIDTSPGQPFETGLDLMIPPDAMHTFKSGNNQVQWKIVVLAQAKAWPTLTRTFPVQVQPALPQAPVKRPTAALGSDR